MASDDPAAAAVDDGQDGPDAWMQHQSELHQQYLLERKHPLVKLGNSSGFTIHPAGVWAARCVLLIDLGTQPGGVFNGEKKPPQHKVTIGFVTTELMDDGRPLLVTQRYTASMHEKSTLRKQMESWRGRKFTAAELESRFHLKQVLGKPAMVNVVHDERDNGKTFANIGSILPLPPGMTAPENQPLTYFSLDADEFDAAAFTALPEWSQRLVQNSPEYLALTRGQSRQESQEMAESDIPF